MFQDSGFSVNGSGVWVQGLGFRGLDSPPQGRAVAFQRYTRCQHSWFMVQGFGFRIQSSELRVWGFEFRI